MSPCQLRNCLERKRKKTSIRENPVKLRAGIPNPPSTQSVRGPQALTSGTHQADCVQFMVPDPVEPSRTQCHGHSHPSMAQVGSPSSCQTKARDPGVPKGLQRPPTTLLPPSRRPRGSSQGGHAQGVSALLQPASSRARLCPAQQPHRLWAKTKGSCGGLKPVKQGTKTCPRRQGVRWLWPAGHGRLAGYHQEARVNPKPKLLSK